MHDIAEEGLDRPATEAALMTALRRMGARGYHRKLDDLHTATFSPRGDTLLVTFEEIGQTLGRESGLPLSFDFEEEKSWSLLHVSAARRTWFRGKGVYSFFDDLADDVFFDEFDRVIFYGAGSGGFAAAAYSVAAPGARVVAIEPQGAIGMERAGWDSRFRTGFPRTAGSRYANPPDLIQAAEQAFIIHDPNRLFDRIHASLFQGENVTKIHAHNLGIDEETSLETALEEIGVLHALIERLGQGDMSRTQAHQLLRARHHSLPWTIELLEKAARNGHRNLALQVIDNMRLEEDRIELRQLRRRVRLAQHGDE